MEIRNEQLHMAEAFEFYYALGAERSLAAVAERFGYELSTVQHWSSWFKWRERLRDRDNEIARETATKIMHAAVKDREAYQSFIRAMIGTGMEKYQKEELEPHTVTDVINLLNMEIKLTDSTDDLTARIENRAPLSTIRSLTITEVSSGGNGDAPMDPRLGRRIAETIVQYSIGPVEGDGGEDEPGSLADSEEGTEE